MCGCLVWCYAINLRMYHLCVCGMWVARTLCMVYIPLGGGGAAKKCAARRRRFRSTDLCAQDNPMARSRCVVYFDGGLAHTLAD